MPLINRFNGKTEKLKMGITDESNEKDGYTVYETRINKQTKEETTVHKHFNREEDAMTYIENTIGAFTREQIGTDSSLTELDL